jgi:hypothetical protein
VVELAGTAMAPGASAIDATAKRAQHQAASSGLFLPLDTVDANQWRALADRAIEPNGYYLPDWELAVNASAPGRTGASALAARNDATLVGLMPVVSLLRAYKIPLPALVSAHPYGTLCTPLLERASAEDAAAQIMQAARDAGARALLLREVSLDGAAMKAFNAVLRDALSAKKLKELRRQRHRLADHGTVAFEVARSRADVAAAIKTFLTLEASGWKGRRGTALAQIAGDAAFIRRAVTALADTANCEIITLRAGKTPVASGIVLRHQSRAFFFKLGVDERFAKYSPGVQLTLELTRRLCADPLVASADSTASPDHPMINPIWRGRLAIGDVLIPLRSCDPVVTAVHAALFARQSALDWARWGAHAVRRC